MTYLVTAGSLVPPTALSHKGYYPQGTNAPLESTRVGGSADHFVIFTDTFDSNPDHVQGTCGASLSGEVYVHVVALGAQPHETLSVLTDSCLFMIDSTHDPEWDGREGTLKLDFERNHGGPLHLTYHIKPDGSVTRGS